MNDATFTADCLPTILSKSFLPKNLDEVRVCRTGMQEQGQVVFLRQRELRAWKHVNQGSALLGESRAHENVCAVRLLSQSGFGHSLLKTKCGSEGA